MSFLNLFFSFTQEKIWCEVAQYAFVYHNRLKFVLVRRAASVSFYSSCIYKRARKPEKLLSDILDCLPALSCPTLSHINTVCHTFFSEIW